MEGKERKIQKRTIESKEKICAAAYELFCKKGLYHTSTKEIAKLAEVSVGNFYNYYKDKEDIYFELAKKYIKTSEEFLIKLEDEISNDEKIGLDEAIDKIVRYLDNQMERAIKINLFFADDQLSRLGNLEYKAYCEQSAERIRECILHFLKNCPYVCKRADDQVMAYMVFAIADKISISVIHKKNTPLYEEYRDELIRIIIQYVFSAEWKRTFKN